MTECASDASMQALSAYSIKGPWLDGHNEANIHNLYAHTS